MLPTGQASALVDFMTILLTFIGKKTDDTFIPVNPNESLYLNTYYNCTDKWMFGETEAKMPLTIKPGNSKSGGSGAYLCGNSVVALIVGGFDLLVATDKKAIRAGETTVINCSAKFWTTFAKMNSYLSIADSSFQVLEERYDSTTSDSEALILETKDSPDVNEAIYVCLWSLRITFEEEEFSRQFSKATKAEVLPVEDEPSETPSTKKEISTPMTTKIPTGGAAEDEQRHVTSVFLSVVASFCYNLIVGI